MSRIAAAATLLGLLHVAGASAQDARPVQPGGVGTVVATLQAPAGADSSRFRLEPVDGVRPFGRMTGMAPVSRDGTVRLPFTFGIPAEAAAGSFRLGRVHVSWPDGARDSADLALEVLPRRAASFWIGAEEVTAGPGQVIEVGYRLRNRGNAPDTFHIAVSGPDGWRPVAAPATVLLAPGDTAAGTIQVLPPEAASRGADHHVKVAVTGSDVRESRSFRAVVISEPGWLGDLAHVPGTFFIGASSDQDGLPGVALQASGQVRPGTRVGLTVRHSDNLHPAPSLRRQLGGPRLRMTIETPSWDVRAGDIFTPTDLFTGTVAQGRGLEAEVRRDAWTAGVVVAAPWSYGGLAEAGHIGSGHVSLGTRFGQFGLSAATVRRDSDLFGARSQAGAGATWAFREGGHDAAIEVGWLGVQEDDAAATGFTGLARYQLTFQRGSLTARLRKVPATTRATTSQGNEAFLSGSFDLHPDVAATGWAFAGSSPLVDGSPHGMSRGGAGGARLRLPLGISGELLGSYRESDVIGDTLPLRVTRSIRASVDVPMGAFSIETDADLGTTSGAAATTQPYRQLRGGVRWGARRQWAWAGLSYQEIGLGTPQAGADLAGSFDIHGAAIQGGLTMRLAGADATGGVSLWSGATVPVTREIELSIGVDHSPYSASSPWRVSLGATRSFGLPLPFRRQPVLRGLAFEDLNGNSVRDPGEPGAAGLRFLLGPLQAETDHAGEFRFYDAARGDLRLQPAGPRGFVLPADTHLPTRGVIEVPVIRTGSLELTLFMDRDLDQEKDTLETFADGAVVSLSDARGRTRDLAADAAGYVRFGGLAPGPYTITIYPPGIGRTPTRPLEIEVVIEPGARLERTVAVPLRGREIRMRGGN